MTVQLFANNAKTTLAASITSTQTTITVAPGTGALFPSPTTGQQFAITLVSASSSTVYEICYCTARSTDTLTVVRGREGTTGTAFVLGDTVGNYDTAGVMGVLVQSDQLQNNSYTYTNAGGTANALTATINSGLSSVPDGFSITLKAVTANTGASTLVLTLGSVIQSSVPIVKGNNNPLSIGDIPSAGYPIELVYSSTYGAYVMQNPATGTGQFLADLNGYQILPSGIIIQWGNNITSSGSVTVSFPIPFPNNIYSLSSIINGNNGSGGWGVIENGTITLSSAVFYSAALGTTTSAPANGSFTFTWMAIGN